MKFKVNISFYNFNNVINLLNEISRHTKIIYKRMNMVIYYSYFNMYMIYTRKIR